MFLREIIIKQTLIKSLCSYKWLQQMIMCVFVTDVEKCQILRHLIISFHDSCVPLLL